MRKLLFIISLLFLTAETQAQAPGFYLGPRIAMGQTQLSGQEGFVDGFALQVGVSSNKQFTQSFALQFAPYIGMYNGERRNGESDGYFPSGARKIQYYRDIYNIYSVEFPLYVKFTGGFRKANFGFFVGPSLGYLIGGTRSKQYEDAGYNADHGYGTRGMETLKRGMYSGDFGVCAELKSLRGIVAIDFRYHHNFSPLGSLEHRYFSADTRTIGVAWMFDAK